MVFPRVESGERGGRTVKQEQERNTVAKATPRRTAGGIGLAALLAFLQGCPPTGGTTDPNTLGELDAYLNVTPTQQAGPDSYMYFSWGTTSSVSSLEVVESNFLVAPLWQNTTATGGTAIAYISLQRRDATVAHYTVKVRDENGRTAEITTEIPVGPAANTAPHAAIRHAVSSVGIAAGETAAIPVVFEADDSWDEQDGQTGRQVRWDFDGDGIYDTDWSTTLTVSHVYTRDQALRGQHITDTEALLHPAPASGAYQVYVLYPAVQVRDSGGLTSTKVTDFEVDLY